MNVGMLKMLDFKLIYDTSPVQIKRFPNNLKNHAQWKLKTKNISILKI